MDLIESVRRLLISIPATTDAEAAHLFEGMAGRGIDQYGTKLRNWLTMDPAVFPEPINVENVDHVRDSGVDVVLTGQVSKGRVGFQIKSDGDLASRDFTRDLKAQITDGRAWGLSLYVIVLACQPIKKNSDKYMHIVNEFGRSPDDFVLILQPPRAAGLLRAFDTPPPNPPRASTEWTDFFAAVRQPELVSSYLDDWNGILPDERFKPPKEFIDIHEAVKTKPLTIVTGPPAVGKTFCAVQILWSHFQAGREIKWITPARFTETEGPIADATAPPDMKRRVDLLSRYLGIIPRQPPLDSTEFIAAHLKPNVTIYVEDPFGKTDDEFFYSMHTFRFFDLDKFVSAISQGAERFGCHILLTSREALFERWLLEGRSKLANPDFKLRKITKHSYDSGQRLTLSRQLIATRKVVDAERAAQTIAKDADLPFDVELLTRMMPIGASIDQVREKVGQRVGDYAEKLASRIVASNNAERLFLLLLVVLRESAAEDRVNFHSVFTELYQILGIGGDYVAELRHALERYRPFITRSAVTVWEQSKSGKGISFNQRNDSTAYHLEPVHSSIVDAISHHLKTDASEWLNDVARSLRTPAQGYDTRSAQASIALLFIRWEMGTAGGDVQEGMLTAIFGEATDPPVQEITLMSIWPLLPLPFKEKFFEYIKNSTVKVASACSLLNVLKFPAEDAWRLLQILLVQPGMGVSSFFQYGGDPWGYLGRNLDEVPTDLRESLDRVATDQPWLFSYALSGILVDKWDQIPALWQDAFLNTKSLSNENTQEKFLIALAREWRSLTPQLKEIFRTQAQSSDYKSRAMAGIAALVYRESDPLDLEPIYLATLRDERMYVPLRVFSQGLGEDEHDRIFAEALLERANEAAAAEMLSTLLYGGELKHWKITLAESCMTKGGDLARGVLAGHCLHNNLTEFMGYRLSNSPEGEPEPVKLAWLWEYINSQGQRPALSEEDVISLIAGLSPTYRQQILRYLSVQAHYLPRPLEFFITEVGATSEQDKNAIEAGLRQRQPAGESRRTFGFPVLQFVDLPR